MSPSTPRRAARRPLLIAAGVALAAVTLGLVSWQATSTDAPAADRPAAAATDRAVPDGATGPGTADPAPGLLALARRDAADKLAVGRPDAPVVLIEYSDFRCGYCGKFARETEAELVRRYVDQGVLRIEWRNFPIFGEESEAAAKAAWAAARQDRFVRFHAAAYAEGAKEKGFGEDRLRALAREAGVPDLDRFDRDRAGDEAAQALAKDQEEGYRIGVRSTPSFLVNGQPIAGAQPLETFTAAVDRAVKAAAK
ncbi:DsbA family protein [Streptomyces sp. BI20]|uniref:DsbA family protein n=1 Tax=Streptomyces sp. BI20 TaxID=3403460 RepID=UPI003C78658F